MPPIGIELGTSTATVAWYDSVTNRVRFVPFSEGGNVVPSAIWFDRERDRVVVGWQAYTMRGAHKNQEVVLNIRRHMGTRYRFPLGDRQYTPPEICGEILKYLKAEAERFIGAEVTQAVITVPSGFGAVAREHTEEAARIAGMETLMLLPEPVAAAIGCPGLRQDPDREYAVMVYDLGENGFECAIVRARGRQYQVLSTAGECGLGGAGIDELTAEQLIRPRVEQAGFDVRSDEDWAREARARILTVAEETRTSLSEENRRSVFAVLPNLTVPGRDPTTIRVEITQEGFSETIAPLLRAAGEQMLAALDDAGLSGDDLDAVILVGKATRLPAVHEAVRAFLGEDASDGVDAGRALHRVLNDSNPDLLAARGAAIAAASHGKREQQVELIGVPKERVCLRLPGAAAEPGRLELSSPDFGQQVLPVTAPLADSGPWPSGDASAAAESPEGSVAPRTEAEVTDSRGGAGAQVLVGVTLVEGKPARAALYQPLLRRAIAMEWETAFARLAAGEGEATVGVVSREQGHHFGEGLVPLPRPARQVTVEPYLALFFAGLHDRIIDTREEGTFAFVEWDMHGLEVCVVGVAGGAARLLARSAEPGLRTAALAEEVATHVVLPAAAVGGSGTWGSLESDERRRVLAVGERLLRRCWLGGRERFGCAIAPMPRVRALARGATVSIPRDDILAQCRLSLSGVADQVHGTLEEAQVGPDAAVQVVISGEVAYWQEFHGAVGRVRSAGAVVVPPQPECFAARGAAVAAARQAGVRLRRATDAR